MDDAAFIFAFINLFLFLGVLGYVSDHSKKILDQTRRQTEERVTELLVEVADADSRYSDLKYEFDQLSNQVDDLRQRLERRGGKDRDIDRSLKILLQQVEGMKLSAGFGAAPAAAQPSALPPAKRSKVIRAK
jgi:uncharacterized protein YlxW (UPF0749 family)